MRLIAAAVMAATLAAGSAAMAGDCEAFCLGISGAWATAGDASAEGSRLAGGAAGDPALVAEFRALAESAGSDEDADEPASAAAQAAMAACPAGS